MLKVKTENVRCTWSKEETKDLLDLMKEFKVMDVLDGKTRRNKNVYVLLSNELAKKGFNKSSEQVKLKFRTLKTEFFKTKRANNKSGAGRKSMEHFQDLEDLLGERPVAAAVGLDTTMVECFLEACEENNCEEMFITESINESNNESAAFDEIINESRASKPQENVVKPPKKKRSAIQMTLLEIAADIKESQQSTIKMIKEENQAFMAEQRRLHEEYLKETKEIMSEDRKETKEMLLEILNRVK